MDWDSKEVVVSFGNEKFTAKDAILTSFQVNAPSPPMETIMSRSGDMLKFPLAPEPVTMTLEFAVRDGDFVREMFDGTYTPKIRNKKVYDCTVSELLFAVREKVKRGEK
jgi:hypothetical protein